MEKITWCYETSTLISALTSLNFLFCRKSVSESAPQCPPLHFCDKKFSRDKYSWRSLCPRIVAMLFDTAASRESAGFLIPTSPALMRSIHHAEQCLSFISCSKTKIFVPVDGPTALAWNFCRSAQENTSRALVVCSFPTMLHIYMTPKICARKLPSWDVQNLEWRRDLIEEANAMATANELTKEQP